MFTNKVEKMIISSTANLLQAEENGTALVDKTVNELSSSAVGQSNLYQ